eukprot:273053-Rhodomonas_salina.3
MSPYRQREGQSHLPRSRLPVVSEDRGGLNPGCINTSPLGHGSMLRRDRHSSLPMTVVDRKTEFDHPPRTPSDTHTRRETARYRLHLPPPLLQRRPVSS